ncbi:MAG: EAL domain-containing protein [Gammaproteobacteria bacterium]|nr:EAL domain-containing protein [Gammaproteobacteria bacterium]
MDNLSKKPFLSLTWRTILLSSVLLVAIAATMTSLNYVNLKRQHNNEWDHAYQQYLMQLDGLVDDSIQHTEQVGSTITTFPGLKRAVARSDRKRLARVFSSYWPSMQLDYGLEIAKFYDTEGKPLGSWQNGPQPDAESQVVGWVWKVNRTEKPLSIVTCSLSCIQYSLVPILSEGKNVGVLLLGKSLADVLLGFRRGSATDIALFVTGQDKNDPSPNSLVSGLWRQQLLAVTNPIHTRRILEAYTHQDSGSQLLPNRGRVRMDQRTYEVRQFPLTSTINQGHAVIVFVTDISRDLATIDEETEHAVWVGLAGLVIAEILLFMFLWFPMSRLKKYASALPLLAESAFEQARNAVSTIRKDHRLDDETDIMGQSTLFLANRLESLQRESTENQLTLKKHATELSRQKEFVTTLLNTANAIILTQDVHGEIRSINSYGLQVLGYAQEDIIGHSFARLVSSEDLGPQLLQNLTDLAQGKRYQLHHDLAIRNKSGEVRHIAWYHSRPNTFATDETAILSVGHDISERRVAESRLSWLAEHDPLTGLLNRRAFQMVLESELAGTRIEQKYGALFFLDIDQFKDVNDSSGHQAGDILIRDVANILLKLLDGIGTVGRLGGDEFGVILSAIGPEIAKQKAQQVVNSLRDITLPASGRMHRISASLGIALYPNHGESVKKLLANADLAMYQAKERGRGRWHLYSSKDMVNQRVQQRVYWREKIEQALRKNKFELYFQPIMHIRSKEIRHFETLIRLKNDDGTVVTPGSFIVIAESTGMIHRIDEWVINEAIQTLAELVREGADINFSINVSAHTLSNPTFKTMVSEKIHAAGVDPKRLIFEVTETTAVEDYAAAAERIDLIQSLGCRFALDDFGVGFSSFYSLKKLPVDLVKIDGSFIKELHLNAEDQVLVRALTQAVHGFGNQTVAEFVVNEDVFELIRAFGVDYAQGYFIGKPVPLDEVRQRYLPDMLMEDSKVAEPKVTPFKRRPKKQGKT